MQRSALTQHVARYGEKTHVLVNNECWARVVREVRDGLLCNDLHTLDVREAAGKLREALLHVLTFGVAAMQQ